MCERALGYEGELGLEHTRNNKKIPSIMRRFYFFTRVNYERVPV
jgi:hypothetical protein